MQVRRRHAEAPLGAVVGDDDGLALRDHVPGRHVGPVRHARAQPFAFDQAHAARHAELEAVRLEQEHHRHFHLQGLRGHLRHLLQQRLRIARIGCQPRDVGEAFAVAGALQRLLHARIGRDVADRRHDERQPVALQRAQCDLDHHLGPVLAPGHQLHAGSHRPRTRIAAVRIAERAMAGPHAVGHERIDVHPDELVGGVAQRAGGGRIREHDRAARIGHDERVGRGKEQRAKDAAFVEVGRHRHVSPP